jgi:tRNA1(Val) A37 N6-methylase TrmN6
MSSARHHQKKEVAIDDSDFPFRRYYMPSFAQMFTNIREIVANPPAEWASPRPKCPLGLVRRSFPKDYEQSDSITDHFTEPVRIQCREKKHLSPLEIWDSIKAKWRWGDNFPSNTRERRELVYEGARGCNLFNVALGAYLISRFGGPNCRVLDCTAGWGDRLTAAFACDASLYRGWDTNPDLQKVYTSLANASINTGSSTVDWSVECAPFETAGARFAEGGDLHEIFDIVLVAPPFFDQELYQGPMTSTTVHYTMKKWLDEFYYPMLIQAFNACKPDGYILAYIRSGDLKEHASLVLDKMMKYLGTIGFIQVTEGRDGPIRDTFVWQKPSAK